jgi:hypothetical protein
LKHIENAFEILLIVANQEFGMSERVVKGVSLELNCGKQTWNVSHQFFIFKLRVDDLILDDHNELVLLQSESFSNLLP